MGTNQRKIHLLSDHRGGKILSTVPEKPVRIAICVPSGDMVHADFAMCLAAMAYTKIGHPIALINNKGSMLPQNRNNGIAEAKRLGVTHVLFVDSDITFPRDALYKLLAHGKDIVGCTYVRRCHPHSTLGQTLDGGPLEASRGLHEVAGLPMGLMLVDMKVFDALRRPYFRFETIEESEDTEGYIHGEDYGFCKAARDAGFQVWLDIDVSMMVGHVGQWTFRIPNEVTDEAKPAAATAH